MNNLIISFVLIAILPYSCTQKNEDEKASIQPSSLKSDQLVTLTDAQLKNANIDFVQPEWMPINNELHLSGKIEMKPQNIYTVGSPIAGFIKYIPWVVGMQVKKGETLIRLEDKQLIQMQQEYLSGVNALHYANLDLERQKELSKNQATSEKVLQSVQENVSNLRILVNSLAEKLKLVHINPYKLSSDNLTAQISIPSPVSGTISKVLANNGKYVNPGDEMIQVIMTSSPLLVLKAFEKDLLYLKKGQKIIAHTNSNPEKKIEGKVESIVNKVNEEGYASVVCSFNKVHHDLFEGTYMNAIISAESSYSWSIPEEAVISYGNKQFVFLDKGAYTFEMKEIQVGSKHNGNLQILNPEEFIGKNIVYKGAYTLLMVFKNIEI